MTRNSLPQNWAARFFTIWTGQAFSLFGSALVQFALVWWLTQKTGSATVLATASIFALLPQILIGPFAGTIVDRASRRLIMIIADSVIALATVALILLFWSGKVEVWHVYAILAIRSVGGAFHRPAMLASTSLMVPDRHLARVAGADQTLDGLQSIIAPPLGALLIGLLPMQQVLMVDVVTAAMAVLPLLFIAIPQPVQMETGAGAGQPKPSFLEDFREGFRYVAAWPGLMAILVMATIFNFLLYPSVALIPLLVTQHFKLGVIELGWLDAAIGVGLTVGGLVLSVWGGFRRRTVTLLMGVIGLALGLFIVGVAPANLFGMAIGGMLLAGFMNSFANGPLFAIVQSTVRPDMQGRVMSLIASVMMAMSPLSLLVAGPVSDWLGIQVWFWLGGMLCILMSVAAFFIPVIMNIEDNRIETGPAAVPVVE